MKTWGNRSRSRVRSLIGLSMALSLTSPPPFGSAAEKAKAVKGKLDPASLKVSLQPKVYAAMSIHVEGMEECPLVLKNGNVAPTRADCDLSSYNRHIESLQKMTNIFVNGAGVSLPLSLEFEENFLSAAKVFQEAPRLGARLDAIAAKGHSLGPHGDAHGYYAGSGRFAGLGQAGIEQHFQYLRDTLLSSDVQTTVTKTPSLSGVCASGNWLKAAEDLGFDTITGLVSFCLLSLPEGSVPSGDIPNADPSATLESSCPDPSSCHATYPYLWYDPSAVNPVTGGTGAFDLSHPTRPWRTDSRFRFMGAAGQPFWSASVSSGATAMVPGVGSLYCLAEKKPSSGSVIARWESETHCKFCQDDIDTYFEILDQTLTEAGPLLPRVVATVYSLGTSVDKKDSGCAYTRAELLSRFTKKLQTDYVDTGKIKWMTLPELGPKIR